MLSFGTKVPTSKHQILPHATLLNSPTLLTALA